MEFIRYFHFKENLLVGSHMSINRIKNYVCVMLNDHKHYFKDMFLNQGGGGC